METIKIKYLGGNRAREVNVLTKPEKSFNACHYSSAESEYLTALNEWEEAEKNLREFEIGECLINCSPFEKCSCMRSGSTHNAIILENGKVGII